MRSYVVAAFVFSLLAGAPVLAAMPGVKFVDCELAPAEAAKGACHIPYDKAFSSAEADDGLSTTDTATATRVDDSSSTATGTDSSTETATTTSYDITDDLRLARRSQAVGENLNTDMLSQRTTTSMTGSSSTTTTKEHKHKHAATASVVPIKRNIATATTVTPAAATFNAKRAVPGGLLNSASDSASDSSSSSDSSTVVSSTASGSDSLTTVSSTSSSVATPTIPPMLPQGMKRSSGASDSTSTTTDTSATATQTDMDILKRSSLPPYYVTSMLAEQAVPSSIDGATLFVNLDVGEQSTTTVYYSGEQPTATSSTNDNDDDEEGHFIELDLLNFGSASTTTSSASETATDA